MDNLQSVTYQTFEQDPVKYRQYEEVGDTMHHLERVAKDVSGCIPGTIGLAEGRESVRPFLS